jgi:hypothetical protein
MTNYQSIAGAALWMAIAAVLMLVAFEPVSIERAPAAAAVQVAKAPSADLHARA